MIKKAKPIYVDFGNGVYGNRFTIKDIIAERESIAKELDRLADAIPDLARLDDLRELAKELRG